MEYGDLRGQLLMQLSEELSPLVENEVTEPPDEKVLLLVSALLDEAAIL